LPTWLDSKGAIIPFFACLIIQLSLITPIFHLK
jgi:hypothetical protein